MKMTMDIRLATALSLTTQEQLVENNLFAPIGMKRSSAALAGLNAQADRGAISNTAATCRVRPRN